MDDDEKLKHFQEMAERIEKSDLDPEYRERLRNAYLKAQMANYEYSRKREREILHGTETEPYEWLMPVFLLVLCFALGFVCALTMVHP